MYVKVAVSALRNPSIGGHLRIAGATFPASILVHNSAISALVNPVVLYMRGLFLLGSSLVTQSFRETGRLSRRRAAIQRF
jgi:hypothetical protein